MFRTVLYTSYCHFSCYGAPCFELHQDATAAGSGIMVGTEMGDFVEVASRQPNLWIFTTLRLRKPTKDQF